MAEAKNKAALVISAHSADFVWRAGGAIALYAGRGWRMKIVCLSFGERGESAKLWREGGMTLDRVKALRREEALEAAGILGYVFAKLDCEPAPMLLALILGPMMEEHLRRAMLLSRGDPTIFLRRPISLGILLAAVIALVVTLLPAIRAKREEAFQE